MSCHVFNEAAPGSVESSVSCELDFVFKESDGTLTLIRLVHHDDGLFVTAAHI